MARAVSTASAGWPSSARCGASAASAQDRDPSSPMARAAASASRRAWSRSVGARRGASATSAADRPYSGSMARAASSASAGWPSSARRGASAASAWDHSPPKARAASSASRSKGSVR